MSDLQTLTVGQLIERLKSYSPDSEVSLILELRSGPGVQDLELQVEDEVVEIVETRTHHGSTRVLLLGRSFD
jgi:hypothetical protein